MYFKIFLCTDLYVKISIWYLVWFKKIWPSRSLLGIFKYKLVFKDTYKAPNSNGTDAKPTPVEPS